MDFHLPQARRALAHAIEQVESLPEGGSPADSEKRRAWINLRNTLWAMIQAHEEHAAGR